MTRWTTYAGISNCDFVGELPLPLAGGIEVRSWPNWFASDTVNQHIGHSVKRRLHSTKLALACDYECEALGTPDPSWTLTEEPTSFQDHATARIASAAFSLWLVKDCRSSVFSVLHSEQMNDGTWLARQVAEVYLVLTRPDAEGEWTRADFETARALHEQLLALPYDDAIGVAVGAAAQGLSNLNRNVRFIMCWVALEAIFGAGQDISFKLAHRIAALLHPNGPERKAMRESVSSGYGWRSKVVHGAKLANFDFKIWAVESTRVETILRAVLAKILQDDGMRTNIQGKDREKYLDARLFEW